MKCFLNTNVNVYNKSNKNIFGRVKSVTPIIELISISYSVIYNDASHIFCGVNKDFDLKAAMNRWKPLRHNKPTGLIKDFYLRDGILKDVYRYFYGDKNFNDYKTMYKDLKRILPQMGIGYDEFYTVIKLSLIDVYYTGQKIQIFGYDCDYDWIVFKQIVGSNLDKYFVDDCIDLKKELIKVAMEMDITELQQILKAQRVDYKNPTLKQRIDFLKVKYDYQGIVQEHSLLHNAFFVEETYKFLRKIHNENL